LPGGQSGRGWPERSSAGLLCPGHPCGDAAVLMEPFGNSIRHSRSGDPSETVTVAVRTGNGVVRVEVTDRSGPGVPELARVGRDAEGGRGLQFVAGLAARWGWRRRGGLTVTWSASNTGFIAADATFGGVR
jgi:two-component sensor histidine kinase